MPRRKCIRRIGRGPRCALFKPAGIPAVDCEEVLLELDELEAVRLADLEGMYQEKAAEQMKVSRQTFGRIVVSARKKISMALVEGRAIRIEGGIVMMTQKREFRCFSCGHEWELPMGTGRPAVCPKCGADTFGRGAQGGGRGQGGGGGRGQGGGGGGRGQGGGGGGRGQGGGGGGQGGGGRGQGGGGRGNR